MFNYKNLCDYEFEILCKDIMQKKLGVPLQIFARGRDGGIDITDDTVSKNVVIQVKHCRAETGEILCVQRIGANPGK